MAYSLDEEKEQLNGVRSVYSASPDDLAPDSGPQSDDFEQQTPPATSKEHNGRREAASSEGADSTLGGVAHNHLNAGEFQQGSQFNTRQQHHGQREGALAHNHLDVTEFQQQSSFNSREEYKERLEETLAHSHLPQVEHQHSPPTTRKEHNGQLDTGFPDTVPEDEFEEDLPHTSKRPRQGWLTPMVIGTGIGFALTVVGMGMLPKLQSKGTSPTPAATESVAPSLTVTVAPVETTMVARTLAAKGEVAALDLLPVLPLTTGLQIKQVMAEEGDTVKVGQILAVLDNSILQAQLQQAKAQLESSQAVVGQRQAALAQARATLAQSQRELARYQYLANQGAVNRQDLDTRSTAVATNDQAVQVAISNISSAQADVRNNQAKIQQLQTQLEQTVVRAPANGIVAERVDMARVGYVTGATQKLFSIIRDGYLELQAKVPETQLPEVRIGAPVTITSSADNNIRIQGKVREISPLINQDTRQAIVKVNLPSSSYKEFRLRPGMFLQAVIVSNTAQALTVPPTSVQPQSAGKGIVYLLNNDNTVRAQTVEVGVTINRAELSLSKGDNLSKARVEIKSGLKLGDRVVVDGAGYLKDGDKVRVVQQPRQ